MRFMIKNASLVKRLAASVYELLSLIAVWLLCTFVFVLFFGGVETAIERYALQLILWVVAGIYFVVCWRKTGQTLAAQAWKIKLVNMDNNPISLKQALLRYILATLSLLVLGAGFLWALVDKEQLFLHDRILNTRIINIKLA